MRTNEAFKSACGGSRGTNFMTPNWIDEGKRGKLHYELTKGRGIENQPIFGVTVVEEASNGAIHRPDLSQLFQSLAKAKHHIASL